MTASICDCIDSHQRLNPSVRGYRSEIAKIRRLVPRTWKMRALVIVCLLVVTATSAMAEPLPRAVLIIDESDPSSGAPTTFSATLRMTLSNVTPNVAVFGETLDLNQFEDPWQQAILRTYVQQKYNDVRFGVVVAVGASALDLVRRWRSELWPDATVVFAAIDEITAAELKPDFNMTGLMMRRTIRSMH
jgi:hypothetical protein